MLSIDDLVPQFTPAVASVPDNALTWRALSQAAGQGRINARTAAMIHVAVAQRLGCEYGKWVMERLAARQWISAEDIFFAGLGVAMRQDEDAAVRAAARLATRDLRTMKAVKTDIARTLGAQRTTDLLLHVSLAIYACDLLNSMAPGTVDASARTRQAGD